MIARRIGRLGGVVVLLASGTYFFVYLWRWEWNRAIVAGILFLAAEIGLATVALLDRLRALSSSTRATSAAPDPEVLAHLRETAPPGRDHFEWLSPRSGQVGVFVPVLMGMGVVVSAAAWLIERLSRATARPVLERRLASRLTPLSWPAGSLVPHEEEAALILSRPVRR
jgi:hypothetical protein